MVGGALRWMRARVEGAGEGCAGEGCAAEGCTGEEPAGEGRVGGAADGTVRSARGQPSGRGSRTWARAARLALALTAVLPLPALLPLAAAQAVPAGGTTWVVRQSEAYDALCFLNPLLGDPFYTRYYPQESDAFRRRLGADALAALDQLDGMRRASGAIVSAAFTNLFSAADPSTLADDLALARDPAALLAAVERESPAWTSSGRSGPCSAARYRAVR